MVVFHHSHGVLLFFYTLSCVECIHVSWCTTVRNKSIIINNENALISSDYYIICVNKTHQGPCARVDFDQVNERCSGTHLFQFGGVPDGVNVVVDCLNEYCSVSGPAIGDLFGFLHLSAAI